MTVMRIRNTSGRGLWLSVAVHGLFLFAIVGVWKRSAGVIAPMRLPGSRQGMQRMLVYSMGGAPLRPTHVLQRNTRTIDSAVPRARPARQREPLTATVNTSPGVGSSGESALGDGNISIALVRFHPRPTPDLSALPLGAAGDVVLDATIDADGRIAGLKLTKGFGGSIDQTVIATVQQWTFSPATKDGVPVASEQEILFHYERS